MAHGENINRGARRREKKPPKKITEKYLHNAGLAYLQRFTSSVPNFRRVMMRKIDKSCNFHKEQDKEACLAMLDKAVAEFERQGYLNDAAYTTGMVTSLRRRGLSSRAIQYKLQSKGLTETAIKDALGAFDGDANADFTAAVQLMKKKRFGCYGARAVDEKQRNRQMSAFARAGFGFDIVQRALALSLDEADEILQR